jgi:hypothetical protein
MTSPLRRKHLTTAPERITPARTAAKLMLILFLSASPAWGQAPPRTLPQDVPSQILPTPLPSAPVDPPVSAPAPAAEPGSIQQAAVQPPPPASGRPGKDDDTDTDIQINTDIPSLGRLTQRDSEADLFERIRQEARKRPGAERVPFPEEQPLTKEPFAPRPFPPLVKFVEASYVAYGRLTMEQPNYERAGWDLGIFQPGVCLAGFYWDTFTLPYQMLKRPFNQIDTSAGKCLPGDPDPLVLYPPELSLTGMAGQAAAITTGFLAFPPWLPIK